MELIANSLPANRRELRSQSVAPANPPMLPTDAIDALWIGMADVYGHRWTSAYGNDPAQGAGGTWSLGLAGLTTEQVGQGVQACIASSEPWPPTLPEFRAMCLGIPSFAAVRLDTGDERSPFTVLVWQHLDGYAYRHASLDRADRMLREAYELAREYVMRGGALPDQPVALVTQERREIKPAAPEVAQAHIAEARELLADSEPFGQAVNVPTPQLPRNEIEAAERELRQHYQRDGKALAAGVDA